MRYFKFSKLVRDKIVEHLKNDNQIPHGVRSLDKQEYLEALLNKLVEESKEVHKAEGREEIIKELADMQEVLRCLKETLEISDAEIELAQQKKREANGGFSQRTYIDYVEIEEDNPWVKYYLEHGAYPELQQPPR